MIPPQGAKGVSDRKRARDTSQIAKGDLEYHDRRTSGRRVIGASVGTIGLAYTVPRMKTAHQMVAAGKKSSHPGVRDFSRAAGQHQKAVIELTNPVGVASRNALARSQAGRAALKLPRGFRNGFGALAAAELVRHSVPVRRDRYREVVGAPMYGAQ